MAWDVLDHAKFTGPAFPAPYVRVDLEKELTKRKLLVKTAGIEGEDLQNAWDAFRRKLRNLVSQGGTVRIYNHVFEPLVKRLGFKSLEKAEDVSTREGLESGGYYMNPLNHGPGLRVWATDMDDDLDAPARRGRAYRFSPVRIAQRVLLASGERIGLISNGSELRILICDPARPDSQIEIPIDPYWKKYRKVPDTYRMLLALACPPGIEAIPDLVEKARLQQRTVTKELRVQARQAVVRFMQNILDHPENRSWVESILLRKSSEDGRCKAEGSCDDKKLQRFGDLAESHGFSRGNIPGNDEITEGRKVCTDQSDAQSGNFDSIEHSGGSWSKRESGISSFPVNNSRLADGTRNSNTDLSTSKLSEIDGSGTSYHPDQKHIQYDQGTHPQVEENLNSSASRLPPSALMTIDEMAKQLWREGLVIIYRLLFILKLESSDDPARAFSFASTSLWRNTFSPSVALAPYARKILDKGEETQNFLEDGVRNMFRMFSKGLECTELNVKPLGGALFGEKSTPILSGLRWGEQAVAHLLDRLLWTPKKRGSEARERVHYGPLDVEDLGRVYEALLELEPGYSTEPMCRLRRSKLEVVVPVVQGEKYRPVQARAEEDIDIEVDDDNEDEKPAKRKKTKVEWIEEIQSGRFYLRVGLGRKASGSYYTPHSFVRFLVQETLGPQVEERSPKEDPNPCEILKLKVLDPAMGSGHFLVEACRFLGDKLYEACRLCDEYAVEAERGAEVGRRKARGIGLSEYDDKSIRSLDGRDDLNTKRTHTSASRLPPPASRLPPTALKWRQRIIDLPDPEDEIVKYLPSRAPEGEESGLSQKKAEALCRRMVAVHCLYGVDKNPLAVELAKLTLWIETHAEGMPLTFMDHRLVVGDSLTGPFWDKLIFRPGKPDEPIKNLFHKNLDIKFGKVLSEALSYSRDLEASVGVSVSDIDHKRHTKEELDRMMLPFRIAAAAWSGGVMLGSDKCDDEGYSQMLQHIAETGELPECTRESAEGVRRMTGGIIFSEYDDKTQKSLDRSADTISERTPSSTSRLPSPALKEMIACGKDAIPFDLTFPEVFYPNGVPHGRRGFHAVLGNPPWDAVRPKAKEFFAGFDFDIMDAPTKRERTDIESRLKNDPYITKLHTDYESGFSEQHRIHDILYKHQVVEVDGKKTGGDPDLAKLFMERNLILTSQAGLVGIVIPSAFHANEGATGIRRLYLNENALKCCYSFENRRKLFEIDSRFKFATVVASRPGPTQEFSCAFYLHDDEWLFSDRGNRELKFTLDFVKRTGGEYLSLIELKTPKDLEVAEVCFKNGEPFGQVCERLGIRLGRELHMTDDAWRFTPTEDILPGGEDPRDPDVFSRIIASGFLPLHEGKTFHQYTDHWEFLPRYLLAIDNLRQKQYLLLNSLYYRLTYRMIAASTNERTAIFSIHHPGVITGDKGPTEHTPAERPYSKILFFCGIANSYSFDFILRIYVSSSTVNYFFLVRSVFPKINSAENFISHNSLRLICNHVGYQSLWKELLSYKWNENKPPFNWPVLENENERWEVRSAIDAIVADAYNLSRDQYEHVLSTFSHTSYPKAPELCLAKFDELKSIGLEAFTKKYDPYWDIPLNENLPQPDPVVSAAIEKFLGEADKTEGGRRKTGGKQKGLFDDSMDIIEKE